MISVFPFSWECHHPNGLSLIFFRGVAQPAAKYDYHNQYHHPYHIRSPQHITNFHMVIYNLYIIYLYNIHIQSGVYIIYIYTYIYIYIYIYTHMVDDSNIGKTIVFANPCRSGQRPSSAAGSGFGAHSPGDLTKK